MDLFIRLRLRGEMRLCWRHYNMLFYNLKGKSERHRWFTENIGFRLVKIEKLPPDKFDECDKCYVGDETE